MPGHQIRSGETGGRREGRRSLSAYRSNARGRVGPDASQGRTRTPLTRGLLGLEAAAASAARLDEHTFNAGVALALVYPLLRLGRRVLGGRGMARNRSSSEGAGCMKRKPTIKSLQTVSLEEAIAYLDHANGDELDAAYALAMDRNRLDGSAFPPDDAEVHHAYFLLCRARGLLPPSFDDMRVELRRRVAA
jgi:hypothetical protein